MKLRYCFLYSYSSAVVQIKKKGILEAYKGKHCKVENVMILSEFRKEELEFEELVLSRKQKKSTYWAAEVKGKKICLNEILKRKKLKLYKEITIVELAFIKRKLSLPI